MAGEVWHGMDRIGLARPGVAGKARIGLEWFGLDGHGAAGGAWQG